MNVSQTKISFLGDRCSWDLSGKMASLAARTDLKIVALNIGVQSAACAYAPSWVFAVLAGLPIAVNVGMEFVENKALERAFGQNALKNKCIDTKPDLQLPSNLDRWGIGANKAAKYYGAGVIGVIGLLALCAFDKAGNPGAAEGFTALGFLMRLPTYLSPICRLIGGWRRWSKVATGEYRISDKGPPPVTEKQDSECDAGNRNAVLVPAPVRARSVVQFG